MFLNLGGCGVSDRPVNEISCRQPKACTVAALHAGLPGLEADCARGGGMVGRRDDAVETYASRRPRGGKVTRTGRTLGGVIRIFGGRSK